MLSKIDDTTAEDLERLDSAYLRGNTDKFRALLYMLQAGNVAICQYVENIFEECDCIGTDQDSNGLFHLLS